MVWSTGWAQTTIWSEDWTGKTSGTQPKNMKYDNVVYSNKFSKTKIVTEDLAGGTAPELLLSGKSDAKDTWTVTINDLKGCYGEYTLSLYTNNSNLSSVKVNGSDVTLSTFKVKGENRTATFTVKDGTSSLKLEFTPSSNTRIDNVVLTATSAGESKTATNVSFDSNSNKTFTFTEGKLEGFSAPTATETNNVEGTITYSSNNESVVTVNASTGALTFPGYGTATITATFTPNDTEKYAESTDSYIVVNKHDVGDAVFYESFDKCDGIGGNDNRYSGSLTTKPALSPEYGDNSGWKFTTGYIANKCVRFGTSSFKGSATTPTITVTGKSILSFKAAAWDKPDDRTNITVSVPEGSTLKYNGKTGSSITVDINKGAWTDIDNIEISGAKTFTITFAGNGGNNRFFLDEVMVNNVTESGETTAITLDENSESNTIEAKTGVNVTLKRTMVKGEWNTICLPFEVSEKQAKDAFGEGVKIATLNKKSTGTTISFEDISILGIPASEPCLIKPSIDYPAEGYIFKDVTIAEGAIEPMEDSTDDSSFGFVGIYNKTDISTGIENTIFKGEFYAAFLGAGNKIYKTDGSGNKTKGFRAYFAIPNGAAASALRVVIDGTATSIKNIDSEVVESNAPVYNLQGQRVNGNNLTPGIYVKAGKKFVVK